MKPDFPVAVDSSMRATFVGCPYKFRLEYLEHWRSPRPSIHLVAGGAFAKAMEITRLSYHAAGDPPQVAIGKGMTAFIREYGDFETSPEDAKSCERMLGAVAEYFAVYGLDTDSIQPLMVEGRPCVEFSFAIPLPIAHPQSGDPILYCGRFDMLGLYNGGLYAVDEKTTGQLGPSWHKNWTLRSQLTGYCWAAREYGYPVVGAIIRGISILKEKYGHAESIQYRPDWMIARWYGQLIRDIENMIRMWNEDYFDFNLDSTCSSYGGCPFLDVCNSPDPVRWLEADFVKRRWDPLRISEVA